MQEFELRQENTQLRARVEQLARENGNLRRAAEKGEEPLLHGLGDSLLKLVRQHFREELIGYNLEAQVQSAYRLLRKVLDEHGTVMVQL
jgi:hypothetical protein